MLHAAFVSALHKLIGVEFGTGSCTPSPRPADSAEIAAYFLQNVVTSYERHFASVKSSSYPTSLNDDGTNPPTEEVEGKECSNLIVLLSELYNFQVVSCVLVYDIIRGLLDGDITEFKVELLLKITRST